MSIEDGAEIEALLIRQAVKTYIAQAKDNSIVDEDSLYEHVRDIMAEAIDRNLHIVHQYLEYKKDPVSAIFQFISNAFMGIFDGRVRWTRNSIERFTTLLTSMIRLENKEQNEDLKLIADFGHNFVFPKVNADNKKMLQPLISVLFSFFKGRFGSNSCQIGKSMFLDYIFKGDKPETKTAARSYVLQKNYSLRLRATNYERELLTFMTKENLVYNADLVWTDARKCVLAERDFDNLMVNVSQYYDFDTSYLLYIDQGDVYFQTDKSQLKLYKEIYNALYNLILVQSVSLDQRKDDQTFFIESTEAFINMAKAKELKFADFDINIEDFYVIFKLINLHTNMGYFTSHDSRFLRFNVPKTSVVYEFLKTIKNIDAFLSQWVLSTIEPDNSVEFTLDKLSGAIIPKSFTHTYVQDSEGLFIIRV